MKNILSTQLKHGSISLYFSILVAFVMISFYNLSIGFVMSPDSYTYSEWADDLIKLKFNFYDYFVQNTFFTPSYFYTTPVVIVALLKVFFGSAWHYAFLVFNLSLVLFSLILFSKSLLMLGVRPILISVAMGVLVLSVDLLLWPRYMLSDTIFTFLVILATFNIIRGIVMDKTNFISLISIMVITLVTRPSSVPILFAVFSFFVISRFQIYNKPKLLLLIFILGFFVISPFIFAYLHHLIEINLSDNIQGAHLLRLVGQGEIINDRPETWLSPPNTFSDVAYLYFVRMISFFTPYAAPFSIIHIALNSLQTIIILLSIALWVFLAGNLKLLNKTVFFILLLSFSVAAFAAFTIIDYDWRYRFPIILPLMMLFPISMEILLKKIKNE
jgi:hypothetical protein